MIIRFNVPLHQSRKIDDLSDQYNIFKANYEGTREELKNRTWNERLSSIFEQDYEVFVDTLVSALKSHTPLQTPPRKKRNIYMSKEALRLKNTKLRLWKRYLRTRTRYDRKKYTRCKNSLRALRG